MGELGGFVGYHLGVVGIMVISGVAYSQWINGDGDELLFLQSIDDHNTVVDHSGYW